VVTGAADRAPERVRRLVYLDAFVPENGKCLLDYVERAVPSAPRAFARKASAKAGCAAAGFDVGLVKPSTSLLPDSGRTPIRSAASRRRSGW